MNAVLALAVILAHTISEPFVTYERGSLGNIIFFSLNKILSAAVAGFIFLSSLKFFNNANYNKDFNYLKFISNKLKKLYLPYLIFTAVYYLYFVYRNFYTFDIREYIVMVLKGSMVSPFYFIIAIFQFYLLMPVFKYIADKFNAFAVIAVSLILNMFFKYLIGTGGSSNFLIDLYIKNGDIVFISFIFYWIAGVYAGKHYKEFHRFIINRSVLITILFLLLTPLHIYLSYQNYMANYYYKYAEIAHIIFCSLSMLELYIISVKISGLNISFLDTIFKFLSSISYYLYLSHSLFIYLVDHLFYKLNFHKISARFIGRTILVFFLSILVSGIILNWRKLKLFKKRVNEQ